MKELFKFKTLLFFVLLAVLISCDEDEDEVKPSNPLVAIAGSDQAMIANETIQLDGRNSRDKNNKGFRIEWTIKSKPAGGVAEIINPTSVQPYFTASLAGAYVIQLQISRDEWKSTDELSVVVKTNIDANEAVTLSGAIFENTVLPDIFSDPAKVDYLVTNDLEVRADLQIAPGVVMAFERDKGLQILTGSLHAVATAEKPIMLKGNGSGKGFWKGVLIYTNSDLNNLEHVTIQQGGSNSFAETGVAGNIVLAGTPYSGAGIRISNSAITQSGGYGLYLQGSSVLNAFSTNNFQDNVSAAAHIPAGDVHKLDEASSASNNGFDGIETSGTLWEGTVTWKKLFNGILRVTDSIIINAGLTINPGLTLTISEGKSFTITQSGHVHAVGTANEKIQFTGTSGTSYWNGMIFNSLSQDNVLEHCVISNAGMNVSGEAQRAGNVILHYGASLRLMYSTVKNGLGYGIVKADNATINGDVLTANTFENLLGKIYPSDSQGEDKPALTGVWVEYNTFIRGLTTITEDLYDRENNVWFGGAPDPSSQNAALGLLIRENGEFIWTAAQYFSSDCPAFTVDYLTGDASFDASTVTLNTEYWRSMSATSCDPSQNVDTDVTPTAITLSYEIQRMYNVVTGEAYWELKVTQPDNSVSKYYRK